MSSVQSFQMELKVPEEARAVVIGKGGGTIKRFQQSTGISLARLLPCGKFQIRGDSREAVQRIADSIKYLISRAVLSKSLGYFPQFYHSCFCKSVEKPLLAVDKVCFEKFTGPISYISQQDKEYLCFKRGEAITSASSSSYDDNLAAAFSSKMPFSAFKFLPHWDFSAYKSELLSCFELQHDQTRNIKMIVRFGKELFSGRRYGELVNGGFISLSYLQELCGQKLLTCGYSTAVSDKAVADLRLHLERLHYVNVSLRKKISVHVADREEKPLRLFNISVRCVGNQGFVHNTEVQRILCSKDYFQVLDVDIEASAHDVQRAYRRCLLKIEFHAGNLAAAEKAKKSAKEASDCLMDAVQRERYLKNFYSASKLIPSFVPLVSSEKAEISRVRREPRRHGLVSFCREGRDTVDFRLAVMSHAREMETQKDMVEWVEEGWRNRTADGLFVFNPASRYEITNIRYKEAETYVTEDFKFRIARVSEGKGTERERERRRWECALTSRWSKWNDGIGDEVECTLSNDVITLIKEALKFSQLMSPNPPYAL